MGIQHDGPSFGAGSDRRQAFLEVADLLRERGIDVPNVLGEDCPAGWLVIEDLGDETLAAFLEKNPEKKPALYTQAVQDLARAQIALRELPASSVVATRKFDVDLLRWEIDHFREWGLEARGITLSDGARKTFDTIAQRWAERVSKMPYGFVHRDDRDSALARWPDRIERPLRIWISSGDAVADWRPRFRDEVGAAFDSYSAVGIPVRFVLATDSANADVHVRWIDRFKESISGKTVWSRDDRWWIVDGDITLALHHRDGDPLDGPQVRAIALHEIGHLLGLDHTSDSTNIMAPRVRVRGLSQADQATLRLLYSVPAGKIKG